MRWMRLPGPRRAARFLLMGALGGVDSWGRALGVDVDGTLLRTRPGCVVDDAVYRDRPHDLPRLQEPIRDACWLVRATWEAGQEWIVVTGRPREREAVTRRQLLDAGLPPALPLDMPPEHQGLGTPLWKARALHARDVAAYAGNEDGDRAAAELAGAAYLEHTRLEACGRAARAALEAERASAAAARARPAAARGKG